MTPKTPTPETDAHAFHRINGISSPDGDVVDVEVSRTLEQKRDKLKGELALYRQRVAGFSEQFKQKIEQLEKELEEVKANYALAHSNLGNEVFENGRLQNQLATITTERDSLLARMDECGYPAMLKVQNELKAEIERLKKEAELTKRSGCLLADYQELQSQLTTMTTERDEANKAQKQDHKTMLALVQFCQDTGVILGSPEVIEAINQLDRIIDDRDSLLARMDERDSLILRMNDYSYPEMLKKQNELKAEIARLKGEAADAKRDYTKRTKVLFETIPETYGDAIVAYPWLKCDNHEWDNRTTQENALYLITQLQSQLASMREAGKGLADDLEKKNHALHVCWADSMAIMPDKLDEMGCAETAKAVRNIRKFGAQFKDRVALANWAKVEGGK